MVPSNHYAYWTKFSLQFPLPFRFKGTAKLLTLLTNYLNANEMASLGEKNPQKPNEIIVILQFPEL